MSLEFCDADCSDENERAIFVDLFFALDRFLFYARRVLSTAQWRTL
jgi:hypothetical protein